MKESEIFDSLCIRDKRNTMHLDIYGDYEPDEIGIVRGKDCYCDNCFRGNDKLALEILRSNKAAADLLLALKYVVEFVDDEGEWSHLDAFKQAHKAINKTEGAK